MSFVRTFLMRFINSRSTTGNLVMSPPIKRRSRSILGLPMNATCMSENAGHQSHSGPKTILTVPKASNLSIAIGSTMPSNETSSCTSGSLATHLNSMSSPTSFGTSSTHATDANTRGSVPSVNLEKCKFLIGLPCTSLFKMGSTASTTELEMARLRKGHHCCAARLSHGTRSFSGNVIHFGSMPHIFARFAWVRMDWSYVSSFKARMTCAVVENRSCLGGRNDRIFLWTRGAGRRGTDG